MPLSVVAERYRISAIRQSSDMVRQSDFLEFSANLFLCKFLDNHKSPIRARGFRVHSASASASILISSVATAPILITAVVGSVETRPAPDDPSPAPAIAYLFKVSSTRSHVAPASMAFSCVFVTHMLACQCCLVVFSRLRGFRKETRLLQALAFCL